MTWNRLADVERVLERLGSMDVGDASLHAIVVDNASDDGTTEHLRVKLSPERVVSNDGSVGSEPSFEAISKGTENRLGLGSITVVRNATNLGGCGGFNTGLSAVGRFFGESGSDGAPDFVWLLDDDIDLPVDAFRRLRRAAETDPSIALVGSRTVDLSDRRTTIESTIYFDRSTGMMGPSREGEAETLQEAVSGVRDVDIVSACSMLVRWAAVGGVGLWDDRFFIYCDDADWCLRIKRAGWRVVCALDAVVYHTPWTHKLTPVRGYYLHRNLLWMNAKHLEGGELRRVWLRWSWRLLRQAKSAALNRRMTEAVLTVRAVSDAVRGVGGKLAFSEERCGLVEAMERSGALGGEVVALAVNREGFDQTERVRAELANALIAAGRLSEMPRWRVVLREGDGEPVHGGEAPMNGAGRVPIVRYRGTRLGKLVAQRSF
ncbi:MAG: glycosyltransferase family 2 protein, partial [Planctomycetota bacterium]